MRGIVSLISCVLVVAVGLFIYRSYFAGTGAVAAMGSNNPRAVVDVTGVKNDLLAIAQAERNHMMLNGSYASLDDLHTSGELLVDPARSREGYSYSAEIADRHFSVNATYSGPATGMPSLSIDETMQIASR